MIGKKINATGMTGFVNEERTRSQWGQWRRETNKCHERKSMHEPGHIFMLKLLRLCERKHAAYKYYYLSSSAWLAVSPCHCWDLSALSLKEWRSAGWWWCTMVWMRWQGHTWNHNQAWVHVGGKGNTFIHRAHAHTVPPPASLTMQNLESMQMCWVKFILASYSKQIKNDMVCKQPL